MRMRSTLVPAVLVLAASAGSASAALITISGGTFAGSFGTNDVLAQNSQNVVQIVGATSNASFVGDVEVANLNNGTSLLLTLTNFIFTSESNTPLVLTIDITQDYDVAGIFGWTGSHQFNGNMDFTAAGQVGNLFVTSQHEGTNLPDLLQNEVAAGPGIVTLNRGQGAATIIAPVTNPYTIRTVYTMTLTAGSAGPVSLVLPNSGVDQASLIPVPSSAVAMLLGMGGMAKLGRNRRRGV